MNKTEEYKTKVVEQWGDKWDLSETEYINAKTKVRIICKEHGSFDVDPYSMRKGTGNCPGCSGYLRKSGTFIEKAKSVWGDRWDYSLAVYEAYNKNILIRCKEHDLVFSQRFSTHMRGSVGCNSCRLRAYDLESFLQEAHKLLGDRWDYSKTEYVRSNEAVTITCRVHGDFKQSPKNHLVPQVGCPTCRADASSLSTEDFLTRATQKWGDRWDYSKTMYKRNDEPFTVVCKEHGEFTTTPASHLRGDHGGCPDCQDGNRGQLTTDEFVGRAKKVWGDRWDYSNTAYVKQTKRLTIRCVEHDVSFEQFSDAHLRGGVGCPKCYTNGESKGENEVAEFIESLGFPVEQRVRGILSKPKLELDILIPGKSVAIEFNGVYFHSDKFVDPDYHKVKMEECGSNGIRLVQVWEDDWRDRKDIVKESIRQILGVSELKKVNARDTEVKLIDVTTANDFLNKYHIQGKSNASIRLGLFLGEEVVAVMLFMKAANSYTLSRYASKYQVRGGHSKLLSYFEKNFEYEEIVTFADLTMSTGELYKRTGWTQDSILLPDYKYVVGATRYHKFGYRKEKFKKSKTLIYKDGLTERQLAELNNLNRVYDAGKIRFVKKNKENNVKGK